MTFNPCAIVPSHNHHLALSRVIENIRQIGLPVFIVDDGSDEPARSAIAAFNDSTSGVQVVRLPVNCGKGAAVSEGFRFAQAGGYSHAVQIDADGQHDLNALPRLLERARINPDAIVSGKAVYDESVVAARRIGRWFTHIWVFIETLSFRISDSMCGFRVYPLVSVLSLLAEEQVGKRMDFDTEIMVRLFWRGVPPVMLPVKVTYPVGNISNFDMLWDNWRISKMHTRLVLTLLMRLPRVLAHRPRAVAGESTHWAAMAERGTNWGLRFVASAYLLLGRRAARVMLAPIVFYFFAAGAEQRRFSQDFLRRTFGRPPSMTETWRHFTNFSCRTLDTLAAWTGGIPKEAVKIETPEALEKAIADRRGALLIVSHHGNVEIARALMSPSLRDRLTILVYTRHAANYNRILSEIQPEVASRLIQVSELGPETAILLQERVARGEWVAIAGDRVPLGSRGRTTRVSFLGAPAVFSLGPYILASLLGCRVWLMFCRRDDHGGWNLSLESFAETIDLPRGNRDEALTGYAAAYASRLESECRYDPMQWYNFFDFWGGGEEK